MTVADRLIRAPVLTLGGATWRILFDHGALLSVEEQTGLSVFAGEVDLTSPSAKVLRACLAAAMSRTKPTTPTEAGRLMTAANLREIRDALLAGYIASILDPDPDESIIDQSDGATTAAPEIKNWLDAWAIARYDLRLTDAEWLAMTPVQVQALRKRQLEAMRRDELLTGIIASTSANYAAARPQRAMRAEEFMLHPFPVRKVTGDDIIAVFSNIPKSKGSNGVN